MQFFWRGNGGTISTDLDGIWGMSDKVDENNIAHFGAFFAPTSKVSGANAFNPGQGITLQMYQFEASVGWAWLF